MNGVPEITGKGTCEPTFAKWCRALQHLVNTNRSRLVLYMTPASHSVVIEPLSHDHWPAIRRLYADGIATGNAAFKTETTARDAWDRGHLSDCRLVTRLDDAVIAWQRWAQFRRVCAMRG